MDTKSSRFIQLKTGEYINLEGTDLKFYKMTIVSTGELISCSIVAIPRGMGDFDMDLFSIASFKSQEDAQKMLDAIVEVIDRESGSITQKVITVIGNRLFGQNR